ncbi:putative high mobility group protein [Zalerion maritima]|uniref:High mobility group protein n=1 Tax=Zalerion maritima TaxID=339359 RepID=A0AAD5RH01_9PEZI|nr:putative high mobility group protein [Zalerion maritima]
MPRPSKKQIAEQKAAQEAAAAAAVAPIAVAPVQPARVIDVDNFIRVRDSVYARLSTIQDLIKSFSVDYLRQTNLLLGEPTNIGDSAAIQPLVALDQHLGALGPQFAAAGPVIEEKKERKKRTHDPNAPKRPLTPYFLYMQTARPIIANDLGENAPKGAVQEEGQRRWASMNASEKQGWNQAYQYNLRLYNAKVHSYKNGNPDAKNMDDDEANAYANTHGISMPPVSGLEEAVADDDGAIVGQLEGNAGEEASSEEAEKPAKTPKAKQPRKRKTATPAVDDVPASPEKKRKRTSTKPAVDTEVEPKKSGRRKSGKN